MNILKKVIAIATSLALVVMFLPIVPVQAATVEELQAQIAALTQQLQQLQSQLASLQGTSSTPSTNVPAACVGITFDRNLSVGATGADVKCLQSLLNQDADTKLADSGAGSPGNETEYFGPITKAGVIKFQEKYADDILASYGLTKGTGFVGVTTRAKLNALLSASTGGETAEYGTAFTFTLSGTPVAGDYVYITLTDAENVVKCSADVLSAPAGVTLDSLTDTLTTKFGNCAGFSASSEGNVITVVTTGAACKPKVDVDNKSGSTLSIVGAITEAAGGETGPTTPVTAGLSVALADDNPASATIVADSADDGVDGAQALVPFLSVTLTNGDSSDVKVTGMNFKRTGISADSDISQAYLYDGDTKLAEYNSFSDSVLSFSNSNGLFTIPAGSSKTVTLRADIANGIDSGKTIRFSIESDSDITADASAVNGTFPLVGNYMSTANTDDLGKLDVTTSTQPSTQVDPQDNFEVFNFDLAASDQDIKVYKLTFTNIGSTAADDLVNFKLYDGGVQVGETVANMNSDKTVTFDLSSNPLLVEKGTTKNMHLKADIVGGTNRNFKFSIQNMTDVLAYDTQYGVYIKPNQADSWTVVEPTSESTIQTGKLTISRASDSASGNVPKNGTNVSVAKFNVKATGEDVKISSMVVDPSGADGLYQVKVYFDGSQKGQTTNIQNSETFSFGNTFIVPADGQDHTLEVKADIKTYNGGELTTGNNFYISLTSISALGKSSMQEVTVGSANGYTLTVASGDLTVAKNQALADWSVSTLATGVKGATDVLVGSFVLTSGAAEGSDVSSIVLKYATDTNSNLQNLKLYAGPKETGTQIGNTLGTFSADTNYTFSPSPYLSIDKGEQVVLYVYADILTGASTGDQGDIVLVSVSGTGKTTSRSVSGTPTNVEGQSIYIADHGTLGVSLDPASNPNSDILVCGSVGNELAKYKFSASTSPEAIEVTNVTLTTSLTSAPTSTLNTITLEGDGISKSLASLGSDGTVSFDLSSDPWVIPAYGEKVLTIKSNIGVYPLSYSGGQVTVTLATTTYKGEISGESDTANASAANPMLTYRTKPTITFVGPSSGTLTDGDQTILEFTVSADSGKDLNVYGFNLGVVLTDAATSSSDLELSDIRLYDKSDMSTVLNSIVGVSTDGSSYTTSSYSASTVGSGDGLSSLNANVLLIDSNSTSAPSTIMDVVPAGSNVTYVVKANVTNSANDDSVKARVSDLSSSVHNAILWGDQTTADIGSLYVKTVPTAYSSLSR